MTRCHSHRHITPLTAALATVIVGIIGAEGLALAQTDAGALRVLLPPPRPVSGRPATFSSPARRRHALELDQAQAARLVRLWRLLGRVGEREFGPKRN